MMWFLAPQSQCTGKCAKEAKKKVEKDIEKADKKADKEFTKCTDDCDEDDKKCDKVSVSWFYTIACHFHFRETLSHQCALIILLRNANQRKTRLQTRTKSRRIPSSQLTSATINVLSLNYLERLCWQRLMLLALRNKSQMFDENHRIWNASGQQRLCYVSTWTSMHWYFRQLPVNK